MKKITELNHKIEIEIILKCLYAIKHKDFFYFNEYGKMMIENFLKQQLTNKKKIINAKNEKN
jgi:hypothetical protein